MSSSEQQFGQYTSSTNERTSRSDQESLKSIARSFLECLDQLGHDFPGMRCDMHKRIIHICLEEILANYQSGVVLNESTYSSIGDLLTPRAPTAFNNGGHLLSTDFSVASQPLGLQHFHAEFSGRGQGMLPRRSRNLTEAPGPPSGMNLPFGQMLPAFVNAPDPVSYDAGQPLYSSAPQHVTYTEGQAMPGPSASNDEEPIMLGGKERVKCGWPGCSSIIRKDGRTRHENETHLREFKFSCARCGRGFPRRYMKSNHERTCHGLSS